MLLPGNPERVHIRMASRRSKKGLCPLHRMASLAAGPLDTRSSVRSPAFSYALGTVNVQTGCHATTAMQITGSLVTDNIGGGLSGPPKGVWMR